MRACLDGRVRLSYTEQIRKEIFLILRNIKAPDLYKERVNSILDRGIRLTRTAGSRLSVIREDPEDDKFLECARLAQAEYLITNDDHLLRLGRFDGTIIIKPSEFRRLLR